MRAVSVILYSAQMSTSGAGRHPDESGRAHGPHPAPNPKTPRPPANRLVDARRQAGGGGGTNRLGSCLRGSSSQRRGPCSIHRGDGRGRTFSVNLADNVFHCFDVACAKKGDVIDLWAAVKAMSLREAALDLIRTFDLEPAPRTEKRNG